MSQSGQGKVAVRQTRACCLSRPNIARIKLLEKRIGSPTHPQSKLSSNNGFTGSCAESFQQFVINGIKRQPGRVFESALPVGSW
jgi:hypothetical protein